MITPVPIRNRLDVLEACRNADSLEAASKAVGLTVAGLRSYCWKFHLHNAYLRLERGRAPNHHPAFIAYEKGKRLFGGAAHVVSRERNSKNGNARWRYRFVACGHEAVREAIYIRATEKAGHVPRCPECREARS